MSWNLKRNHVQTQVLDHSAKQVSSESTKTRGLEAFQNGESVKSHLDEKSSP